MKVAVMGAGAVGCYYGGMLARAGHEVTLIARPSHVEAINRDGLRLETRAFDEHVKLKASSDASAIAGADLVLFSVKSTATEEAGEQIKPYLSSKALVLCLQNGVDNAERLQKVLPDHTVAAAVVYVATEMAGPGHVKHHGRGELVVEPSAKAFASALEAAGIPMQVDDNVRGALWAKLILNSAYNAMSAISRMPYGPLVQVAGVTDVMANVVAECLAVAAADGVVIPGGKAATDVAVRKIAETMPGQYSSTAQDVMRGKPSEIDYLNGYVARRGKALGVPTPVNHALWVLVKLLETKS
jgi:2-dehydropantoate 2-reductase